MKKILLQIFWNLKIATLSLMNVALTEPKLLLTNVHEMKLLDLTFGFNSFVQITLAALRLELREILAIKIESTRLKHPGNQELICKWRS